MKSLEEEVVKKLTEKGLVLTTAESCTGGLIAAMVVNVSGASKCFNEGYITYANETKIRLLGVSGKSIETYGVVSAEVVKEMAEGVLKRTEADISAAVSGIAGPDGGTPLKPVGTVYAAVSIRRDEGLSYETEIRKFNFNGSRTEIRENTVREVLKMLISAI